MPNLKDRLQSLWLERKARAGKLSAPVAQAQSAVPASPAPSTEVAQLQRTCAEQSTKIADYLTRIGALESDNANLRANAAEANRVAQAAIVNINKRANDRALELCAAAGMGPVIVMPSATPAKMEKDGESGTGIGRMRGAIRAQIEKANSIQ
jgi:hypothetical protein